MALVAAFPAGAAVPEPPKTPTAVGSGGSAATVDPLATQTAIDVLRAGGNAVDAAVAAAGVLGVVEPYSCGIGGGGFMVIYDASTARSTPSTSREAAPAEMDRELARALPGAEPVHRGLRERARRRRARHRAAAGRPRSSATAPARCARSLRPGERIAREGFVVDPTFNGQVTTNASDLRRLPRDRGSCTCPTGRPRSRSAPSCATPTWPRPTSASATTPTASTAAASRATSCRPSSTRRRRGLRPPARGAPGPDDRGATSRYDAIRRNPTTDQLPRLRRLRHGPAVVGRLRPSARR